MFLVFFIGSVALQAWAWRRLTTRLAGGAATVRQSVLSYAAWALVPLVLFVGAHAVMIAAEELFHVALVEERAALLALPVLGLGLAGTLAFVVSCARRRR